MRRLRHRKRGWISCQSPPQNHPLEQTIAYQKGSDGSQKDFPLLLNFTSNSPAALCDIPHFFLLCGGLFVCLFGGSGETRGITLLWKGWEHCGTVFQQGRISLGPNSLTVGTGQSKNTWEIPRGACFQEWGEGHREAGERVRTHLTAFTTWPGSRISGHHHQMPIQDGIQLYTVVRAGGEWFSMPATGWNHLANTEKFKTIRMYGPIFSIYLGLGRALAMGGHFLFKLPGESKVQSTLKPQL